MTQRSNLSLLLATFVLFCVGGLATFAQDTAPKIAFNSDRDGVRNIFVMEADGSQQTNLTHGESEETDPRWSPDGQTIAFTRILDEATGAEDIFSVALDGAPPTQLTDGKLYTGGVAWSPDGTQIAFSTSIASEQHVTIINADGTDERLLVEGEVDAGDGSAQPSWSPNGSQIVFRGIRGGVRGILTSVNADGSGEVQLNPAPSDDNEPIWSPDGARIAFVAFTDAGVQLFVVNADGSKMSQLTSFEYAVVFSPRWSPDSKMIAFAAGPYPAYDIYTVSADGGDPINLTNSDVREAYPAWSPDGTQIAFEREEAGGNDEIFVMNADGSNPVNLTNNPADDIFPRWQSVLASDGT